jgi:ABC-type branched-subunit amino acid transport system permease subunit
MFGAFWAGVAGGLFAHVMRFINPGTFGIQRLAEILAMVYFGGLNSVYGSIVGAVSINLISENAAAFGNLQVDHHPTAADSGDDLPPHRA